MVAGIWIGLGLVGMWHIVKSRLPQPNRDHAECIWCDRVPDPPARACSTVCDHELNDLALNHPDPICRDRLRALSYPWPASDDNR